jgi:UDP-N-acetylglucosamine--N-acetylmuramyl-(pentapeptide) pyrophosphoryl-undecaprenol N-acetylglucosamine transferase
MQTFKRVLLTGGGTAGHVNPALAIGSIFNGAGTRFLFVGIRGRVEEEVVPREGIPIKFVRASRYPGRYSAEMVRFLLNLLVGTIQSLFILLRFGPEVIVGTGGYVAAPVMIAASILKKLRLSGAQILMHEQNAVPGKLNRLMGRFADKVFVTFPETLSHFPGRGILVGYPLRKSIRCTTREEALQKAGFKIPEGRKPVLVFGGSQGSRNINRALVDALGHLLPYRNSLFIIHGTGLANKKEYHALEDTESRLQQTYSKEQLREIETFYTYKPFFYHIEHIYALCDLVVARAGAGSLNEISAMGLPALIIPKSNLPGDHQVMNARSMERAGAAEILYEQIAPVNGKLSEVIDGKTLADKLLSMVRSNDGLKEMSRLSRSFFNQDALIQIEKQIDGGKSAGNDDKPVLMQAKKNSSLPGNRSLLMLLEKAANKHRHDYTPERIIPRPQDLEYLKARASSLLVHSSWQNRNLGIKLLGLLGAKEKIPVILTLYFERKPVPWFKKMLGGDFEQVGFIRRNILTALIRLDELTPEIEEAFLAGISDPYYEVREQAALAVAFFGPRLASAGILVPALKTLLSDPNIDVVVAAAEALGKIGGEHDALPVLLGMWDSRLWKVRTAVLRGILYLVKRGEIGNPEAIEDQAAKFILTSTDFRPHFEIKAVYRHLMELIAAEKEKRSSAEFAAEFPGSAGVPPAKHL